MGEKAKKASLATGKKFGGPKETMAKALGREKSSCTIPKRVLPRGGVMKKESEGKKSESSLLKRRDPLYKCREKGKKDGLGVDIYKQK